MDDITLRYQQVRDARRFWEILNHPDFVHWPSKPATVAEERVFLRQTQDKRRRNVEHNFTLLREDEIVGAVGVMIDQRRPHIGEVGYFVAREFWGQGIAPRAVALIEAFIRDTLGLHRIEITVLKPNRMSCRVAEKCGYRKEGIQRGKISTEEGFLDVYAYAKILS